MYFYDDWWNNISDDEKITFSEENEFLEEKEELLYGDDMFLEKKE